jgi:hypothetical protein
MAQYEALQLNEDWIWTTLRALAQTSIIPTWATYLWLLLFFCWFFKAPSCPALLYRMRFLSGLNCYSEKRHALLRSEWLEKNPFNMDLCLQDTQIVSLQICLDIIWVRKPLGGKITWMIMQPPTSLLVMLLINTSLGAEDAPVQESVRMRPWTSTACLSGSTSDATLVGHKGPIACIPLQH